MQFLVVLFVFYFSYRSTVLAVENDTFWNSRYDYDYKMLQKIVAMEQDQKNMKQMLDQQDVTIRQQQIVNERLQTDLTDSVRGIEEKIGDIALETGSTYVRWGRTECPENGTETVYSGYMAGSHYTHSGAAVNPLCLPQDPLWGKYDDSMIGHSYIYGTEYEFLAERSNSLFKKPLLDHNAPCAVCHSSRSSVVMIPGRNACYDGWTAEYTGYIVSGLVSHIAATEFMCLDEDPETIVGGHVNHNGYLLYITEAVCGSLKCPPYVQGRELTCVVCTKSSPRSVPPPLH